MRDFDVAELVAVWTGVLISAGESGWGEVVVSYGQVPARLGNVGLAPGKVCQLTQGRAGGLDVRCRRFGW